MTLTSFEKYALKFLFDIYGLEAYSNIELSSRSENTYATTLHFNHDQNEVDPQIRSRVGGSYYLKHPIRDDFVDVLINLVNGVPVSAEFVPLGMDALPVDLSEFIFVEGA